MNKGVSIYVVQDFLGHTQIKTTQRYTHLTQKALQDAAEVAGSFIDQAACQNKHSDRAARNDRIRRNAPDRLQTHPSTRRLPHLGFA